MMCNHSPRESYSLCEWDHNRPSFAFNSQSDNTLHVHMGWVCACVFLLLTPWWLHGWAWTDVPTGAELPERAETWTLMRRWQNSHSPIKESKWIPFKTGGLDRMRNDKDIPQGRAMVWCDASWRSCGVLEGITRRGMKSLITNLVVKAIRHLLYTLFDFESPRPKTPTWISARGIYMPLLSRALSPIFPPQLHLIRGAGSLKCYRVQYAITPLSPHAPESRLSICGYVLSFISNYYWGGWLFLAFWVISLAFNLHFVRSCQMESTHGAAGDKQQRSTGLRSLLRLGDNVKK